MPLVIAGKQVEVPNLTTRSWLDNPQYRLKLPEDGRHRKTGWVRSIILHTTRGIPGGQDKRPQKILSGSGPHVDAGLRCARWWSTSSLQSGAHLVVDFDGEVVCLADLANEAAFHAGPVNEVSIGIEIYQGGAAEMYKDQLEVVTDLVDFLTAHFGIFRQCHHPYTVPVPRLENGGRDCVGVFGHRDVTSNRGAGDPGSSIFNVLLGRGYEPFDFALNEDLFAWKNRQQKLGVSPRDGIPGPATIRANGGKVVWS